jgi:predicted ABC-type transport system involved in lysophospholipase L1 biosynthesis ATPase subunit
VSAEPVDQFVRLDGVSKAYGKGSGRLDLLRSVDMALASGSTTSLVGRSGSGKSTLLSLIAGLMRPDAGRIWIDGQSIEGMAEAERAGLRADRIGIVLQSDNLIPFLSALENVELALRFGSSGPRRTARARDLLAELGLATRLHHRPRELSGGEGQRVAVAVALANDPDLLLADEVVGQLDSVTAADVLGMIFRASADRRLTVLYVTHDEQLAGWAQRTLRLVEHRTVVA